MVVEQAAADCGCASALARGVAGASDAVAQEQSTRGGGGWGCLLSQEKIDGQECLAGGGDDRSSGGRSLVAGGSERERGRRRQGRARGAGEWLGVFLRMVR